ncbi:putative RDD family membrane protein YckC [Natronobacillus azotifigens]|uniref:RDD family protein n=1 Tax=Natronobacillus azotifigens TaxID=472978 RepID=A0A9J6RDI2_9BACI|nr:RDD family protein [Natronobacillus azotifigens]MCZ0703430.1 RDD family protein [Natronobacillus azotifigens]
MDEMEIVENFRLAGMAPRFGALLLDDLIILVPLYLFIVLVFGITVISQTIVLILFLSYLIILPVIWKGYTVGKKIMNVRIVQDDGSDVTVTIMLLRELSAFSLSMIGIGMVSLLMVANREDRRSIHDFFACTIVLEEPPHG